MKRAPRLGGLPLDPLADGALPLLLILMATLAMQVLLSVVRSQGLLLPPWLAPLGGLVAVESYLFTTAYYVRDFDTPQVLRLGEMAVLLLLGKWLVALPFTPTPRAALLGGLDHVQVWLSLLLLGWAYWFGWRIARPVTALHPAGYGEPDAAGGQYGHPGDAYLALRLLVLRLVAICAVVVTLLTPGLAGRVWGWNGPATGLLLAALLGIGAVLVAAQLQQRIAWRLAGLTPPAEVLRRWVPQGLSLLVLPVLAALLLPAGPHVPVDEFLAWLQRRQPNYQVSVIPPPEPPKPPPPDPMVEMLRSMAATTHTPIWINYVLAGLGAAVAMLLLALLLRLLIREVRERGGRGVWAVLAQFGAWWGALLGAIGRWLGGAVHQSLRAPAKAVSGLLGQHGLVRRYWPGREPTDPRAAVRYFFARLQREAARAGLRRAPGATAAEFAAEVAGRTPEQAGALTALTEAYQEARYASQPVHPEQVGMARRAWLLVARALRRTPR